VHGKSQQLKGTTMPLVNIRVIEGVFTSEEKGEMIHGVTEALVAVEGESVRDYTLVLIEEVRSGDWAVGGNRLTTGDVQALRATSPVSVAG
jgi:4-oxalocrotonate tautomerase